ncbi:MAG: hypothetical protein IH803_05880 [Nitrospirae bacterium]|nr:hypothetical protein [Nitrospirota bacterium]
MFTETNKEEDFGTFVSPRLKLTYESRAVVISGTYRGTAQFFVNNSQENAYAQHSNFSFDFPGLTKRYKGLELELIESFNFSPQLQAFSFAGEPGEAAGIAGMGQTEESETAPEPRQSNQGLFTRRSDAFQNLAGFNLTYAWTRRISPSLSYRNRLLLFASEEFRDSVSHVVNSGLGYQWTPRTQFRISYGATVTDFQAGDTSQPSDSFVSHRATIGARHQFSRTLAFSGDIGTSTTESETRFIGNLRLNKTYTGGTASLRLDQFVGSGGGLAAAATLSQSVVGTIDHTLARRLSGFLLLGFARNESLTTDEIDILTYQATAGLRVRLLSWLNGNVSYSYINQESNGLLGAGAERNTVFIGLTAIALPWRIVN